ncbi:16517_t:CDS:2 [Funneliformis mosseae]|uniref:16517_t:CDS:1 n=1 Tax=Funneliformis mosseae TaxID=27381 RepID=A0A9N9DJW1_FUNMO|nr:16517_t:CDS:2 [Funneliformis mosseae]
MVTERNGIHMFTAKLAVAINAVLQAKEFTKDLSVESGKKFVDVFVILFTISNSYILIRKFSSTEETKIQMANISSVLEASFRESVEAEHSSHWDAAKIVSLLVFTKSWIVNANIDHASEALLVQEAGGMVSDIYSKPLDFL